MSFNEILDMAGRRYPEKEGIIYPRRNQRWTFSEWREKAFALASGLQEMGTGEGDRISAILQNGSELPTTVFSSSRIGATFFGINFRLAAREAEYLVNHTRPKILVFEENTKDTVEKIKDDVDVEKYLYIDEEPPSYASSIYEIIDEYSGEEPRVPDMGERDPCVMFHTAGTTGVPKVTYHTYGSWLGNVINYFRVTNPTEEDKALQIVPLFHLYGLMNLFTPVVAGGAPTVILHQFDPVKVLETIEEENITYLGVVPAMLRRILQVGPENYDLSSFRVLISAAAPLAKKTGEETLEKIPMEIWFHHLGQSEYCTHFGLDLTEWEDKMGAAGWPVLDNETRIVKREKGKSGKPNEVCDVGELGEIITRGSCGPMEGYWEEPKKTLKTIRGEWYYTGDVGYKDEDGCIWHEGRAGDMIISGGENIFPVEVEEVLENHPKVAEVGVAGTQDEEWGQAVTAFIVAKEEGLTSEELDKYCIDSDELANYKRPRRYVFLDEIPKSATSNIKRPTLAENFESGKYEKFEKKFGEEPEPIK